MTAQPLVTVAVAAFDAGPLLVPSIESLLAQTYATIEIRLVDDGSTDGSIELLERFTDDRLIIDRQENRGKAAALNRVLDLALGEYLLIHDADDVSHPERVARLVDHMERHEDLAACYSNHDLVVGDRVIPGRIIGKSRAECSSITERMKAVVDPTGMRSHVDDLRHQCLTRR
ncbi:MAG: glycosyltransferase family A protein [Ilumatobacteraceae bacterium]